MHLWHHADHQEVFFANYSTKFAFWDWIFGTAYLPGHKPKQYGLFYDFPKDYFLQHYYSIKKISESDLLKSSFVRKYYGLRPALIRYLKRSFNRLMTLKKEVPSQIKIQK